METLFNYGLQGIIAYGVVGVVSMILKKRFNKELKSDIKLYILIGVAFAVGFIPADLGNFILNHIKEAVAIGFGIHAVNTTVNKVSSQHLAIEKFIRGKQDSCRHEGMRSTIRRIAEADNKMLEYMTIESEPIESFLVQESAPKSNLTPAQVDRLNGIDWYLGELDTVIAETKEVGVLQASWRHNDRMNIYLLEGERMDVGKEYSL